METITRFVGENQLLFDSTIAFFLFSAKLLLFWKIRIGWISALIGELTVGIFFLITGELELMAFEICVVLAIVYALIKWHKYGDPDKETKIDTIIRYVSYTIMIAVFVWAMFFYRRSVTIEFLMRGIIVISFFMGTIWLGDKKPKGWIGYYISHLFALFLFTMTVPSTPLFLIQAPSGIISLWGCWKYSQQKNS